MDSKQSARNIQKMFNDISSSYDLLNRIISFRRDVKWRQKAVKHIKPANTDLILDLACGTGDMINTIRNYAPSATVLGGDFSVKMLHICSKKTDSALIAADACCLPFKNALFDKITMVFGFRNVTEKPQALSEIFRVLKPGGVLAILEFSRPKSLLFSPFYWFYFKVILPRTGQLISGHKSAYNYLPLSVENFPDDKQYLEMVRNAGFENPRLTPYDLGICSLMTAVKP